MSGACLSFLQLLARLLSAAALVLMSFLMLQSQNKSVHLAAYGVAGIYICLSALMLFIWHKEYGRALYCKIPFISYAYEWYCNRRVRQLYALTVIEMDAQVVSRLNSIAELGATKKVAQDVGLVLIARKHAIAEFALKRRQHTCIS